jgi:hypothetical protein
MAGQTLQADFFDNTGGLNVSDTPLSTKATQATGGYNYDYLKKGGFQKRLGHLKVNSSASAVLKTLGAALHTATSTNTRTALRFTDSIVQSVDLSAGTFSTLTEDTLAAGSTVFSAGSTQPICSSMFTTAASDFVWAAGGGASGLYGVYSASKYTKNGAVAPAGSFSATPSALGGSFASTGTYRYAIAYRKRSTQASSNVALETSATISATTDKVTLDFTGLTGLDTTKYDKILIYRSAVSGSVGFTTGDLITSLDSTTTSYVDTGTYTTTATNVPRAGNTVLDNSTLDAAGSYKTVTTFKRRLVTASGSTLYLSDLNKPESWPAANTITVPSGGPITGLAVISFTTASSSAIDELLVIFKERELWVITGDSLSDWSLKFIDAVGCISQSLIVNANGFLSWIDYRGVYLWDGSGKPIYVSRPVENLFQFDGDIDKPNLSKGWGKFFRKNNQIVWFLSHRTLGEQKYALKLDLRLTLPSVEGSLQGRVMEGVFLQDKLTFGLYGGATFIASSDLEEAFLAGDDSGYVYKLYGTSNDAGAGVDFTYDTAWLQCGTAGQAKRYTTVIAWVEKLGTWNLNLTYWTDYRGTAADGTTVTGQIASSSANTAALWDIGTWDDFYWDDYMPQTARVVFHLPAAEGDAIKLRFSQSDTDAPTAVYGFSILLNELGVRK